MIETVEHLIGDDEPMGDEYKAFTWGDGMLIIAKPGEITSQMLNNPKWIEYPPFIKTLHVFMSHNIAPAILREGLPKSILKFIFSSNRLAPDLTN